MTIHALLKNYAYTLSGQTMWGEVVWCLRVSTTVDSRTLTLLECAASEYVVSEQTVRDWLDY